MRKTVIWLLFTGLATLLVVACTAAGQPPEEAVSTPLPGAETAVATPDAAPTAEDQVTLAPEIATIIATVPVTEEVTVPISPTIPVPSNPTIQQWVVQAQEDLAGRLNVDMEEVDFVEFRSVVWPDSSLGCPQPGMAYTQVQQEGYLIRLQVGKQLYEFHGGGRRGPFLCEKADGENLVPPPGAGNE